MKTDYYIPSNSLNEMLTGSPYQAYAYAYPHKSAYRFFENVLDIETVWTKEKQDQLFLYFHIPFCEMRCGFCNLFTIANPKSDLEHPFISALTKQVAIHKEALPHAQFSRIAIGGGTPTFLSLKDLEKLMNLNETMLGGTIQVPFSIEMSPKTVDKEKLHLLKSKGVSRASIGIQSFLKEELKSLGRPQKMEEIDPALSAIKAMGFHTMNIDLIYGMLGQTPKTFIYSLQRCLDYEPEEIFLYPLYVRPLTGLDKMDKSWDDQRMELYLTGRDFLLENGYEQITMRIFRKKDAAQMEAPPYDSPQDGMLGLGVGARSYTKALHYSSDYAVDRKVVHHIIDNFVKQSDAHRKQITYGAKLNEEEQKRRYLIKSLLEGEDLNLNKYQAYFQSKALEDFPDLHQLFDLGMATQEGEMFALNAKGLTYSDVIGPYLYSQDVHKKMRAAKLI